MPNQLNQAAVQFQRRRMTFSALSLLGLMSTPSWAQRYPVTSEQKATAERVAQNGVPVSELAANAPDSYTVKAGDTLWGISGLYLSKPWRWPELWGMNRQDVSNPHLIYPGQTLYLIRQGGLARLSLRSNNNSSDGGEIPTVKVVPRTRTEALSANALPTLRIQLIEPFLAEPVVVDERTLLEAPHIVAGQDDRVLISRGDRAYARGEANTPLVIGPGLPRDFRVFRSAKPIKNPNNGEILGYEAQYLGRARLERSESTQDAPEASPPLRPFPDSRVSDQGYPTEAPKPAPGEVVPATIDIVSIKEEIRAGDRLLPEPPRQLVNYVPRAPEMPITGGRIASVYGSAVANAAQNQVVAINLGKRDGIEAGHVLAILTEGARMIDKTDDQRTRVKLPDERNGLLMVFRTFDRVSYALILEIKQTVRVGDRLIHPL
ncbi:LysM domain-containing protein [Curvibacter sp. HBC28]|uniref:LysM domain-containing protein n=1 Tax=Curvibacter microcysteis TaxID=3026419 RepID=A0ABT5MIA5_9BURK|nr:LysM domain-containing protein [Curvibacter sp. HBC28]MDD0816156.1 LysM domain-containing protein [Curvibacter sp. HBC28]